MTVYTKSTPRNPTTLIRIESSHSGCSHSGCTNPDERSLIRSLRTTASHEGCGHSGCSGSKGKRTEA